MEEVINSIDQLDIEEAVNKVIIEKSKTLDLSTCPLTSSDIRRIVTILLDHDITDLEEINLSNCDLTLDLDSACSLEMLISSNPRLKAFIMTHNPSISDEHARKCLYEVLDRLKIPHVIFSTVLERKYLLSHEVEKLGHNVKLREKLHEWHVKLAALPDPKPIPRLPFSPSKYSRYIFYSGRSFSHWEDFVLTSTSYASRKKLHSDSYYYALSRGNNRDFSELDFSARAFEVQGEKHSSTEVYRLNLNVPELTFMRSNFYKSNLTACELRKINFQHACFKKAEIQDSHWADIQLTGANLQGARFDYTDFFSCVLTRANARYAAFSNSFLRTVKFDHADLRQATFQKAILWKVDLSGSSLQNAQISEADFTNVNLCGADLRGTDLLSVKNWKDVYLYGATLPDYTIGEKDKPIYAHLSPQNGLKIVLDKLFSFSLWRFENLSPVELKILFLQGKKDRRLKSFIEKYALYIKDICRHRVYAAYLIKFNLLPKDLTKVIIHKAGTPYTPFLNKKLATKLAQHKFFKPLKPPTLELSFFTLPANMQELIILLGTCRIHNIRVAGIKSGLNENNQPCIRGILEGETKLIRQLKIADGSFYENAEQDIQKYFSNSLLPSFKVNENLKLPSVIHLNPTLPIKGNSELKQTFLLIIKPEQIPFLAAMFDIFRLLDIEINAIKTGIASTKAFKKTSKIAGAAYEAHLTHFMKTPVMMIAVKTIEANLKNYAGAEEAFIILKNVEKDMGLFFEPTELVFSETNSPPLIRKG